MPKIMALAVIRMARKRLVAPFCCFRRGRRFALQPFVFRKSQQQNRVCDSDSNRHNRTDKRLHVQSCPRNEQHDQNAAQHGGNRQNYGKRESERLEICGEKKEDHHHGKQQPEPQATERLPEAGRFPAHVDANAARRIASLLNRLLDGNERFSQRQIVKIGGQVKLELAVIAVQLAGHVGSRDRRYVSPGTAAIGLAS